MPASSTPRSTDAVHNPEVRGEFVGAPHFTALRMLTVNREQLN